MNIPRTTIKIEDSHYLAFIPCFRYVDCLCKSFILPKQRQWADMASQLALPYDPVHDYHPQFDGYQRSTQIKQADAVLLGFPLQYAMNRSVSRRSNPSNHSSH